MAKKPQKADYDIFISHSSKDIVCAEQCCEYLEKRGYSCFLDKRDIKTGQAYNVEIEKAIESCQILVLIFSLNADKSNHVGAELSLAFSSEKTIIPYKITSTLPKKLNYFLQLSQWLEATDDKHTVHFQELFERIREIVKPKPILTEEQVEILNALEKNGKVIEFLPPVDAGCFTSYKFKFDPKSSPSFSKIVKDVRLALNIFEVAYKIQNGYLVIEVEKSRKTIKPLKEVVESQEFLDYNGVLGYVVGRNENDVPVFSDLTKEPHLLIAGIVGTELQEYMENIVYSLLAKCDESMLTIYLSSIFGGFNRFKKYAQLGDAVYTSPESTLKRLLWLVEEMERRYKSFIERGVRNIKDYNALEDTQKLKYIVFVIDEFSALDVIIPNQMLNSIVSLLQKARASGIHLIISTARPKNNIIDGYVKANIPSRVVFFMNKEVNSNLYLDSGDGSVLSTGYLDFIKTSVLDAKRLQGYRLI